MLKVATIVGTRPEIIRLSRIIAKFDKYFDHTLVHTGQNYDYELNQVFFEQLSLRAPDYFMEAAGATAAETIGKVIIEADRVLGEVAPDAVLILGDTNSCLAAIAAKRRKIPIFHMEAGNRCFDARVPEEINRKIVDHTADINLTYSSIARDYLLREGFPPDQVIRTGSPLREVLDYYSPRISSSDILQTLSLRQNEYFIVSAHREENVDSPDKLGKLLEILNELAARYKLPVIVSTHPRTRKRLDKVEISISNLVQFHAPFGFLDYVKLQSNAKAVLSDSGTITEESSLLNFPALNLREVHERPEGFEEGAVMMVGLHSGRIMDGLEILEQQPRGAERSIRMVEDYSPTNVSDKVLRIVQSYTDFVNRRVWRR
ncbi:MAG: non-hydrolyzing UDP-N-acetylglucosamine 2-epimerase [Rhizobium rhizophilum]|uniref:non-hydrolyzing UDP-N-acetylglucosamine 2-epimerase n=1 Tax=Rhizobium rhizophilum TaxID=1850373 RepID=UPI00391D7C94